MHCWNICRGDISLSNVMFRMLTQFNNFMEVWHLEPIPLTCQCQNSSLRFIGCWFDLNDLSLCNESEFRMLWFLDRWNTYLLCTQLSVRCKTLRNLLSGWVSSSCLSLFLKVCPVQLQGHLASIANIVHLNLWCNDSNSVVIFVQVRYEMACALCVPATEYTYGDLMLSVNAQRLCLVREFILFPTLSTREFHELSSTLRLLHWQPLLCTNDT